MKSYEGKLSAKGLRLGIVISRFNDLITKELLSGAEDCWIRHDGLPSDLEITWVPGAFEIPVTAELLCKKKKYDAIVCLGAVIRGGTPHFDYVASEVSKGVAQVSMHNQMPVIFGVITTDNIEQALERAGTKSGNKGWNAVLSAIEMANLFKNLQ
ncbi:MAG TPA: 6,7-dimethyl-8-ribityllumazine synthase [Candidatus Marinimicrobia bacterium]|nr:6,7-dimethyl-8-ribityllumazine synthase [Candidatus Neomarinimicrobiota bacterium]